MLEWEEYIGRYPERDRADIQKIYQEAIGYYKSCVVFLSFEDIRKDYKMNWDEEFPLSLPKFDFAPKDLANTSIIFEHLRDEASKWLKVANDSALKWIHGIQSRNQSRSWVVISNNQLYHCDNPIALANFKEAESKGKTGIISDGGGSICWLGFNPKNFSEKDIRGFFLDKIGPYSCNVEVRRN